MGGEVLVELENTGDLVTIRVSDKGTGFPEDFDAPESGGLGMKLVRLLSGQIGTALEVSTEPGKGTSVQVRFSL